MADSRAVAEDPGEFCDGKQGSACRITGHVKRRKDRLQRLLLTKLGTIWESR